MFQLEGLKAQLVQYENQQKSAEQLYHQCSGVIALLKQQIMLLEQFEDVKKQKAFEDAKDDGAAVMDSNLGDQENGKINKQSTE